MSRALRIFVLFAFLITTMSCYNSNIQPSQPNTPPFKQGDRVRIEAPTIVTGQILGSVVSLSSDTLVLDYSDKDNSLSIPIIDLTKVELADQNSRVASGTLILGAVCGGAIGWIVASENEMGESVAQVIFTSAALGGAAGALLGMISQKWETIPLNLFKVERGEIYAISEKVGDIIDKDENKQFQIVKSSEKIESIIFLKLPDKSILMKITAINRETSEKYSRLVTCTDEMIENYQERIESF